MSLSLCFFTAFAGEAEGGGGKPELTAGRVRAVPDRPGGDGEASTPGNAPAEPSRMTAAGLTSCLFFLNVFPGRNAERPAEQRGGGGAGVEGQDGGVGRAVQDSTFMVGAFGRFFWGSLLLLVF